MAIIKTYMHITLPSSPNNSVKNDGSTMSITLDFRKSLDVTSDIMTDITGVDFLVPFSTPVGRVYDIYKVSLVNGTVTFNFTATANHVPNIVHFNRNLVDDIIIGTDEYDVYVVDFNKQRFMVYSS